MGRGKLEASRRKVSIGGVGVVMQDSLPGNKNNGALIFKLRW